MLKTPIELTLGDVYRSLDVKRWQIVKTNRQQSVAEHSYMVAMIAARICHHTGRSQHFTNEVVRYALTHDLPEVLTGDLATPLKRMLGVEFTKRLSELENRLTWLPGWALSSRGVGKETAVVVKMADLIEAAVFLFHNSHSDHGDGIRMKMVETIKACPIMDHIYTEIMMADPMTIDRVEFLDSFGE